MAQEITYHLSFCFLGGHIQSHTSSCGICGGQSSNGMGFSLSSSYPAVIVIPPVLHTHSFMYQRCNIIFTIDSIVGEQTAREKESS